MNSKLCLVSTGGDMSKRGMGDKNTVYLFNRNHKKSFYLDGKIKLQGISAGNYYKNKSAIKKLIKKKEAA